MDTASLASIFRTYCDEPDHTWLTQADVALYLQLGYDQFRALASRISPWTYATSIDIQPTAGTTGFTDYDLTQAEVTPTLVNTPSLLGSKPNILGVATPRLERILALDALDAIGGTPIGRFHPLTSTDGFYGHNGPCYLYRNQVIRMSGSVSSPIRLTYVPTQGIGVTGLVYNPTWLAYLTTGTGIYIDDLNEFHDLIALMAYDHYAIRDAAANPLILARRKARMSEFEAYLMAKDAEASHYVQFVSGPSDGWGF